MSQEALATTLPSQIQIEIFMPHLMTCLTSPFSETCVKGLHSHSLIYFLKILSDRRKFSWEDQTISTQRKLGYKTFKIVQFSLRQK